MPRNRDRQSGPHRRHDSSTTSVSDDVAKDAPNPVKVAPELPVVVELAVVTEGEALLRERLLARGEVDDRQAPVGQMHLGPVIGKGEEALVVGSPVRERLAHHPGGGLAVVLLVGARDAAHVRPLRPRRARAGTLRADVPGRGSTPGQPPVIGAPMSAMRPQP